MVHSELNRWLVLSIIILTCLPNLSVAVERQKNFHEGPVITYTVNSIGDLPDLVLDGVCNTGMMVGGQTECTLRAAIQEANDTIDLDQIFFNISDGCINGICVINVTTSGGGSIPDIVAPVLIDGSTQPGNAGVCSNAIPSRPDYAVVVEGDRIDIGLRLESGSDGSSIRGLNIRNFFNAIPIIRSNNNTIACNFIGTDETGMAEGPGNVQNGVIFGCDSSGNIIGGVNPENGNLISSNGVDGVQFFGDFVCDPNGPTPVDNAILGNFIGTAKDGVSVLGNLFSGIAMFGGAGADRNFIGSLNDGVSMNPNVIGGNESGILFDGSDENLVIGNYIGTDLTATVDIGNNLGAIDIFNATDNMIGGDSENRSNIMAFNSEGVFIVDATSTGNFIQRNSFFSNQGLGIELVITGDEPDGQNLNDPGDADVGPNQLQNYPENLSVVLNGNQLQIVYEVPVSFPSVTQVGFYFADGSNQQGRQFIGSDLYDMSGLKTVVFDLDMAPGGAFVVATASDQNGNTSEFSDAFEILNVDSIFSNGFEAQVVVR